VITDPSANPLEYASRMPVQKGRRTADCVFAWTAIGLVVTIPAFVTAIVWGGGGNGTYGVIKILFPYAMLSKVLLRHLDPVIEVASFAQYGMYGVICGLADARGRLAKTVIALVAIHVIAMVLCFILPMRHY
jgi:hypothetical protein